MSTPQNTQKTLEVKIRKYEKQEHPNQSGTARVYMSISAMLDLNIKDSGEVVYVWKKGENEDSRREVIAWKDNNLKKAVVQVPKDFLAACGFKVEDDLIITSGGGDIKIADVVIVSKIDSEEMTSPENKDYWECVLRSPLCMYFYSCS
jgi:hypothetical protein